MNAKAEFLGHIKDRKVLCAEISYRAGIPQNLLMNSL